MLYNFASDGVAPRGGHHSRLCGKRQKNIGLQAARDSCGEIHIYSRRYKTNSRERSRIMSMNNDWCWHLRHRTNHRSRRSGLSHWRSPLDLWMFGVECWIPIVDRRGTRSVMKRGCNTQWFGYQSDSHTTNQGSHLLRIESSDGKFCDCCVQTGLGLEWCRGMIDTFGCCTSRLLLSRWFRLSLLRRMEHVSVDKHLQDTLI